MNMQAFIGQASFGCYVGQHVWVKCSQAGCQTLVRIHRSLVHKKYICVACRYAMGG